MISLTFVRNSNGSHGTVGRTTGFWSGRYRSESQPLPTFLKYYDAKLWYRPRSYAWKFSIPEFFWNQEGFPHEIFWDSETKQFRRKIVILAPSLISNIFRYPKLVTHLKVSLRKFSAVSDKKIRRRTVIPPPHPFLCMKSFDAKIFFKHRRVPLRSFSILWDKKFSIENRDIPLLCLKFLIPQSSETLKGFPTKVFGTVRQKKFRRRILIFPHSLPPSYP